MDRWLFYCLDVGKHECDSGDENVWVIYLGAYYLFLFCVHFLTEFTKRYTTTTRLQTAYFTFTYIMLFSVHKMFAICLTDAPLSNTSFVFCIPGRCTNKMCTYPNGDNKLESSFNLKMFAFH